MFSNLDLWYCAGLVILGASFSYIVLSALQFMGMNKKDQRSSDAGQSNAPSTQFLRHALLALAGLIIGAQLLQYHQDLQEVSNKELGRNTTMMRALNSKPVSPPLDSNPAATNPDGLGLRPSSRPPRGYFSVAEAEKAESAKTPKIVSAVAESEPISPTIPAEKTLTK
jgi:hypothetical protein